MTRFATGGRIGIPNLDTSDITPRMPVGSVVEGFDDVSQTNGRYVYGKFAAVATEGQAFYIDHTNGFTLLDSAQHANDGGPVGWAICAQALNSYGFLQVGGKAKVKSAAAVAGGKVFASATAGQVDDAAIAGCQISGAEYDTADGTPAAGFAYATVDSPRLQTQIT